MLGRSNVSGGGKFEIGNGHLEELDAYSDVSKFDFVSSYTGTLHTYVGSRQSVGSDTYPYYTTCIIDTKNLLVLDSKNYYLSLCEVSLNPGLDLSTSRVYISGITKNAHICKVSRNQFVIFYLNNSIMYAIPVWLEIGVGFTIGTKVLVGSCNTVNGYCYALGMQDNKAVGIIGGSAYGNFGTGLISVINNIVSVLQYQETNSSSILSVSKLDNSRILIASTNVYIVNIESNSFTIITAVTYANASSAVPTSKNQFVTINSDARCNVYLIDEQNVIQYSTQFCTDSSARLIGPSQNGCLIYIPGDKAFYDMQVPSGTKGNAIYTVTATDYQLNIRESIDTFGYEGIASLVLDSGYTTTRYQTLYFLSFEKGIKRAENEIAGIAAEDISINSSGKVWVLNQ